MPEYTPPVDVEVLARVAFDAENASLAAECRDEIWADERRRQGYSRAYRIAEAVATRRDQDWQTALQARTTALTQARSETLELLRYRLEEDELARDDGILEDGVDSYCTGQARKILATVEAALGEEEQ